MWFIDVLVTAETYIPQIRLGVARENIACVCVCVCVCVEGKNLLHISSKYVHTKSTRYTLVKLIHNVIYSAEAPELGTPRYRG